MISSVPASAQEDDYQDLVSFGIGYYDISDNEEAVDFRAEYRWDRPLVWLLKPWAGAEVTSDGAIYGAGGVLIDWRLVDNIVLTPSFGAGLYADGGGKDLGHTVEFRSQVELGYEMDDNRKISLGFSHISNASMSDRNPGTEVLSLYYHLPADELMADLLY